MNDQYTPFEQTILDMANAGFNWAEIGRAIGMSRDFARRAHSKLRDGGRISNRYTLPKDTPLRPAEPLVAVPATHPTLLRLEGQNSVLQEQNRKLAAQLRTLRRDDSVYERLADVIREETVPLPALPDLTPYPGGYEELMDAAAGLDGPTLCDMVVIIADEHCDLIVTREGSWGLEEYNFNVFRVRLQRLRDLIREYVTIHLPRHRFQRLWVFKLGDGVNGDIHDAGPFNYFRNTVKAALSLGDAEAQFVQSLLPVFPQGVHVVGVSGNHPRRAKMKDFNGAHDNYDYLVGTQIATRLHEEIERGRVTVTLPEAYTAFVEVRGKLWALNHGDDVTSGIMPWVGFDRRNNRVQSMLQLVSRQADFFAYGHYHTPASFPSAGGRTVHSGTWMRVDPFAQNRHALGGNEPTQDLYVLNDKPGQRGLLMPIPIYVADPKREDAMRRGEWEPELGRSLVIHEVSPRIEEGLQIVRAGV